MGEYSNGELYIYERFNDFKIGGRFQSNLMGYNMKQDIIPAGVPASQVYDLILEYNLTDNIIIKMTEGCKHYFEQSRYTDYDDISYMKFGVKYEF